jgi:hypothetical protein
MDTISLNGEDYIKSNVIARELGYTNDYVGQLCRAGKVKSALIGRSWYVLESSIREHKKDRYRNANTKNRQEIKKALHEARETEDKVRHLALPGSNFLHRGKQSNIEYVQDSSELVPVLVEKDQSHAVRTGTTLEIVAADAEKLNINSVDKPYKITRTPLPTFTVKGQLKVTEGSEESVSDKVKEILKESKEQSIKSKPVSKSAIKPIKGKILHIKANEISEAIEFVPLHAKNLLKKAPHSLWYVTVELVLILAFALGCAAMLFIVESHYKIDKNSISKQLKINLSAGIESLKYLYK